MTRTRLIAGIVGAFVLAGSSLLAAPAANAGQTLPSAIAGELDRQPADYTATAAKQRRLMMMQGAQRRNGYGRPGPGVRHGYRAQPNRLYRAGPYRNHR